MNDTTGLHRYGREVAAFLDFLQKRQLPCSSAPAIDRSMQTYMSWLCYHEDAHFSKGDFLLNGMNYVFPEFSLPASAQSLKSWKRLTVDNEGSAIGGESLACMEELLSDQPQG